MKTEIANWVVVHHLTSDRPRPSTAADGRALRAFGGAKLMSKETIRLHSPT